MDDRTEQDRAWAEFNQMAREVCGYLLEHGIAQWDCGDGISALNLGRVVVMTGGRKNGQRV